MEVLIAALRAVVAEDNVRDEVRIQVRNVAPRDVGIFAYLVLEGCRALRISACPAASVAVIGLIPVTINVHVREQLIVAVDEYDTGLRILAVCEGYHNALSS